MGLSTVFKNLSSSIEKMKDYIKKEQSNQSTIVHPEVYPTIEEAQRANQDFSYRAWYSSKKEFSRRLGN